MPVWVLQRFTLSTSKLDFGLFWKMWRLRHCLESHMFMSGTLSWLARGHRRNQDCILSMENEPRMPYTCLQTVPVQRSCQKMGVRNYAIKAPRKEPKAKKSGKPKIVLTDEEINNVIDIEAFRGQLASSVSKLKENYIKNLSLRTSAGRVESLSVEFEGGVYSLNEIAQVARKNPSLLVVNMAAFPQALRAVLDAIQKSGMNLNPQQEGTTIYVPIPQVTREHRENLAKNAKILFHQTKDELHELQNRTIKTVKQKKENFSEDLIFNIQQQIMALTTSSVAEAEEILHKKQAELLGGK